MEEYVEDVAGWAGQGADGVAHVQSHVTQFDFPTQRGEYEAWTCSASGAAPLFARARVLADVKFYQVLALEK